ncbi:hypothetical protein BCR34DRAFT_231072 [Clohesyomyces aquaticus]|uniref:feruloyl esterase n=1 Tax=Clohesyomyces aquaticus TaxID=1231657 RepID=A0A1Y1ZVS5_9PLEO|nr:hypothetical protein BCR34DRAFT_231072 [Clohesyomyces aquaticus]
MFHCSGGPGAWMVGQVGSAAMDFSAKTNVLAAVVEWVEGEKAPDKILGTKLVNDTTAQGVQFQRWHCRYPMQITFAGGKARILIAGFASSRKWQHKEPLCWICCVPGCGPSNLKISASKFGSTCR